MSPRAWRVLIYALQPGKGQPSLHLQPAAQSPPAGDGRGNTALTLAAYNGHTATAEVLLAAGANIGHKCEEGKTALEWAREKGHHETAKMLEEAAKMTPKQRKDK
eukprot:g36705.t1